MSKLNSITIRGYRSIKEATVELRPLNVLIGANGAGKSNLVSFFKLMNELMAERLQQHVASTGHATANLHFGPRVTPQLAAELRFETDTGDVDTYTMRLFHAAGDSLIFAQESLSFLTPGYEEPRVEELGPGHKETLIGRAAREGNRTARVFQHLLNHCRVFHFHDTGPTSRVQNYCYVGDNRWLMPDAGNLAAILFWLSTEKPAAYDRILATIRQVAPFFHDFELDPNGPGERNIILNWRHRESDLIFGPHQLSDGTLRAICLISLLMQPPDRLPLLIIIDEPELGLHPYALNILASLCRSASQHIQILISTQSSTFVNHFDPEDIVVVERDGESSRFDRPDAESLEAWLEDYSLGEIWEKNIIGGSPH
jgi:predicted ATPase